MHQDLGDLQRAVRVGGVQIAGRLLPAAAHHPVAWVQAGDDHPVEHPVHPGEIVRRRLTQGLEAAAEGPLRRLVDGRHRPALAEEGARRVARQGAFWHQQGPRQLAHPGQGFGVPAAPVARHADDRHRRSLGGDQHDGRHSGGGDVRLHGLHAFDQEAAEHQRSRGHGRRPASGMAAFGQPQRHSHRGFDGVDAAIFQREPHLPEGQVPDRPRHGGGDRLSQPVLDIGGQARAARRDRSAVPLQEQAHPGQAIGADHRVEQGLGGGARQAEGLGDLLRPHGRAGSGMGAIAAAGGSLHRCAGRSRRRWSIIRSARPYSASQ